MTDFKCIFCEWNPSLENVKWGICYDCVDKCELDINQVKCKRCKEYRNMDSEYEQPTDKVCIYCKFPDKYSKETNSSTEKNEGVQCNEN